MWFVPAIVERLEVKMLLVISKYKSVFRLSFKDSRSGFSFLGLLISLAIIGITTIGISRGLIFNKQTQRETAIRQSANKFQDSLRSEIAKTARNFVLDDCSGARYGSNATSGGSSSPLSAAFKSFILNGGQSLGTAQVSFTRSPVALANDHKDAARRCGAPVNKGKISGGEYAYFCMKIHADQPYKTSKTVSNQSFWKLDNSFMEVMLIPVDLPSDKPIMCADFHDGGAHGIKVLYSIYFANKVDVRRKESPYMGKRMNGVFYVTGEQ